MNRPTAVYVLVFLCAGALLACRAVLSAVGGPMPEPRHVQTIAVPDMPGLIDHLALDTKRNRLWMCAMVANEIIVFDLNTNTIATRVQAVSEPHGIVYMPSRDEMAVAEVGAMSCSIFNAETTVLRTRVRTPTNPDNLRFDTATSTLFAGCEKSLVPINVDGGTVGAPIALDGSPEAFEVEPGGKRMFVNVPDADQIAVIDRASNAVVERWHLEDASSNFPMALDAANHRLFVGCRSPQRVLVLDTQTGKPVASVTVGSDCDDLFYVAATRRIYASCGQGTLDVFTQVTPDQYELEHRMATKARARTSMVSEKAMQLYLALPRYKAQDAELRMYDIAPGGAEPASQPAIPADK